MCGRYTLVSVKTLHDRFLIETMPELMPRFNIAPTQPVPAVRWENDRRKLLLLRWGLVPFWARDPSIGNRMINARSEDIDKKPAFRKPFQSRRCLIPADGFYEWKKMGSRKQPMWFGMKDRQPFAFAGLWDCWKSRESDDILESCTILTTEPNELCAAVHDRMPVILPPQDYAGWLDPATPPARLLQLLRPYPAGAMIDYPVSLRVNSPRNDDPSLIEPMKEGTEARRHEGTEG